MSAARPARRITRRTAARLAPPPATFPCAVCGTALRRVRRDGGRRGGRGGHEGSALAILCPRCRFRIYDYPRVCVGMLVVKRGHLLMLTRGEEPRRGSIDVPGGFLEAGEDLEAAARRELREETTLTVGRAAPLGTWWDVYDLPGFGPFPTLNHYFLARWRSGAPRAGDDAAEAHWVPFDELGRAAFQRRFAWQHMRRMVREVRRRAAAG